MSKRWMRSADAVSPTARPSMTTPSGSPDAARVATESRIGRPPSHARRRVVAACVLTMIVAGGQMPANADTVAQRQAEAKRIAAERERLTQRAEQLNERANRADDELATLTQQLAQSQELLTRTQATVTELRSQAVDFAVASYMHADESGGLAPLLTVDGGNDIALRRGYAPLVLGNRADVVDQLNAERQDADAVSRSIDDKVKRQRGLVASIRDDRVEITRTNARLVALAATADRELADAIKVEQARKAAEAEAAAAARQRAEEQKRAKAAALAAVRSVPVPSAARPPTRPGGGTNASGSAGRGSQGPATQPGATAAQQATPIPATSPAAAAAVAEALRQLGKPYVFGTNGPNTFDCSGLTQWAWAKASVSMAHYTVSQYNAFPHVSLSQLQPGDLVFFNVDLGHMGMYIGNGNIIQAPRTGDVVKISALGGRNLVGAVRPG